LRPRHFCTGNARCRCRLFLITGCLLLGRVHRLGEVLLRRRKSFCRSGLLSCCHVRAVLLGFRFLGSLRQHLSSSPFLRQLRDLAVLAVHCQLGQADFADLGAEQGEPGLGLGFHFGSCLWLQHDLEIVKRHSRINGRGRRWLRRRSFLRRDSRRRRRAVCPGTADGWCQHQYRAKYCRQWDRITRQQISKNPRNLLCHAHSPTLR